MDEFARLPARERAEIFNEAAAHMGVSSIIIEKDFWVCWALRRVFSIKEPRVNLIFKGGTALSKAYQAIQRFSEDVDLSLDRHDLEFDGERDPAHGGISGKQRKALLGKLSKETEDFISARLLPAARREFENAMGEEPFELSIEPHDCQTIMFKFPQLTASRTARLPYILSSVRLEFGSRSDHLPAELRKVAPYIHDYLPHILDDPWTKVRVLGVERTFWEKATILHALAHQGGPKAGRERLSRHYLDLAQLSRSEARPRALEKIGLLEQVAQHKSIFFRQSSAHYEEARPGSLRLVPDLASQKMLQADYEQMKEMIFGEAPSFDEVLVILRELENEINH